MLWSGLASLSARLGEYPAAMEYFRLGLSMAAASGRIPGDALLFGRRVLTSTDSRTVSLPEFLAGFEDGKEAASYAMLVAVKQPVPGKRRAFTHLNNVGHTFITLVKYNRDGSSVSRSFGFYPYKSGWLAATPFHPRSPSVFKDDGAHAWDELAGKFISPGAWAAIMDTLRGYEGRPYHLSRNNCTDFGLRIAALGGISIRETVRGWPFGKGNNPGSAGQSMLEGKLANTDADHPEPLFVSVQANEGGVPR